MNTQQSTPIGTLSKEIVQNIENKDGNNNVIPTGFEYLDEEFGGLSLGELVVIGGRPAMGKSQFVINLVSNICDREPILFFSFDLTPTTLTSRILSNRTGISVDKLIRNQLIDSDVTLIKLAAKQLENSKLLVSDIGVANINETIDIIKEHVELYHTKIVVIDYLQLLGIGKYNTGREAEIGHICRVLKMCAKELNICIVLLSQLSRAVEVRGSSKKPQLSDLRDSGSIEQIADKVWLLYRPEYYMIEELDDDEFTPAAYILMLVVAKNKNGKIGVSYFKRNDNFTEFNSIKKPGDNFEFNEDRLSELQKPTFKELNNDNEVPF
ncbi:DnaB-like helicase C-terminal domain-containing protein [Flavobacterium chungnamense]|uniref:SF4 helicase domain-containing protein n=1 Tax=Flavobacterium chungnamense TaxID=706182 RepID=A0ABP7V6X6_9FLAO